MLPQAWYTPSFSRDCRAFALPSKPRGVGFFALAPSLPAGLLGGRLWLRCVSNPFFSLGAADLGCRRRYRGVSARPSFLDLALRGGVTPLFPAQPTVALGGGLWLLGVLSLFFAGALARGAVALGGGGRLRGVSTLSLLLQGRRPLWVVFLAAANVEAVRAGAPQ